MVSASGQRRGIVTGAASGIGHAVVRRMIGEGVDVLAVDVAADRLKPLEGPNCRTLAADLSDPDARDRLADFADGADYLVCSHGVILIRPIFEITLEEWRRVQTINAESIFFLCQKIGPRLKPGGAIVNMSSSSA